MSTIKNETNKITAGELTIIDVPLSAVDVHPAADRHDLDENELKRLAASLTQDGQLQPCLGRPLDGGRYQLIYGSRRYHAAIVAGLSTIRIDVREINDRAACELAGIENLMRRDFNPIELADYLTRLTDPIKDGGGGMTVEEVATRFGKSDSWVRNVRRLAKLPEYWRHLVALGVVPERNARLLVPHVKKSPVMNAIKASYEKSPAAWKDQEEFSDQVRFIVFQFEKLAKEEEGLAGGPVGRMIEANRLAATETTKPIKESKAERSERQTASLARVLDEAIEGLHEIAPEPGDVQSLLAPIWESVEKLRAIAGRIEERIVELS